MVINDSINFDTHVWGDIYRNGFLLDVKNPPEQLTPDDDGKQPPHFCIDFDKLQKSDLWIK